MSEETTATCRLGATGRSAKTFMNWGSCASSFCCMSVIDCELSIMKRMSRLLLIFWVKGHCCCTLGMMVGASTVRSVQAQSEAPAAARPTQRRTRQLLDDRMTGRFMGVSFSTDVGEAK